MVEGTGAYSIPTKQQGSIDDGVVDLIVSSVPTVSAVSGDDDPLTVQTLPAEIRLHIDDSRKRLLALNAGRR
jgi:hypothetical protein